MARRIIWEHTDEKAHPATGERRMWRIVDTEDPQISVEGPLLVETSVIASRGLDAMGNRIWTPHWDMGCHAIARALADILTEQGQAQLMLHAYGELMRLRLPFDHDTLVISRGGVPGRSGWAMTWSSGDQKWGVPQFRGYATTWNDVPTKEQITADLECLKASQ